MSEKEFLKLSFHDRGIVLFTDGKYLLLRDNDSFTIKLFSLYGFFVEVFFSKANNKITSIELVSLDTKKRYYYNLYLKNESLNSVQ